MSRQWSMQAELSISNEDTTQDKNMPTKEKQHGDGNVVRMVYTITANPQKSNLDQGRGHFSDSSTSYGFQRGNMTFTSTPPNRLGVQDSGYNSDLQFSSSQNSGRTYVPYERRCRSTCSITLSTNENSTKIEAPPHDCCPHPCVVVEKVHDHCDECRRTQSLPPRNSANPYYSTHFCTKLPEKQQNTWSPFGMRDMMTQTVETKEKCTSPLEKMANPFDDNKSDTELSKCRKRNVRHGYNRKKVSNVVRRHSDLGSSNKNMNRNITRSPGILFDKFRDSLKTQTVHIDVYCTGSDGDTSSDSTIFNSDEEMDTIFSSEVQKISHRRAKKSELPVSFQNLKKNIPNKIVFNPEIVRNDSYSGDESSTTYPSALSSYSTFSDFERSFSTTYPNWCDRSVSNCTLSEMGTSTADLGPRYSISESESASQRRFDLRNDDSFISEKTETSQEKMYGLKNDSSYSQAETLPISETEEASQRRSDLRKGISARLGPQKKVVPKTDSFEYADSSDVERIKKMEQVWNTSCDTKTWRSPQSERKHKLQQQKIQEYIERKLKTSERKLSESSSSSSESENSTVIIYDKDPNPKANLTRGSTIQKSASKRDYYLRSLEKNPVELSTSSVPDKLSQSVQQSTSSVPEKLSQSLKKSQDIEGPFANAKIFGNFSTRTLGRHIGPAKNPHCQCAHCKSFFSEDGGTNRTKSVGNTPFTHTECWRYILKPRDKSDKPFTDY